MTETVLVTGGAGFIGAYVTRRLLAEGCKAVVYDAQPRGNALDLLGLADAEGVTVEAGEITDGWRLLGLCRAHGVTRIVHLASPLTMDVHNNPTTGIRDICLGTSTVFSAAREARVRRVVWASSVAVFGTRRDYPEGPLGDGAFHKPPSLYGSCKSLCETLALRAYSVDGVDSVGLRLSVVYGAGRLRGYMSYPSHLIREAATHGRVHIKYGPQRLHWQYVEEVAAMISTALFSERPGRGLTYNAVGDCRSWQDAADALKRARPDLEVSIGGEIDPALADTVEDYDASGFSDAFAYRMAWPLEKGVADALSSYEVIGDRAKNVS